MPEPETVAEELDRLRAENHALRSAMKRLYNRAIPYESVLAHQRDEKNWDTPGNKVWHIVIDGTRGYIR